MPHTAHFPHSEAAQNERLADCRYSSLHDFGRQGPGPHSLESEIRELDGRTAREWTERAAQYCEWRAGQSGQRLSDPAQRWNPNRVDYLDAAALLTDVLYTQTAKFQAGLHELPASDAREEAILHPAPPVDPRIAAFAASPRAVLVGMLIQADSHLSDAKMLSHLQKSKLARMLCAAQDAQARSVECIA